MEGINTRGKEIKEEGEGIRLRPKNLQRSEKVMGSVFPLNTQTKSPLLFALDFLDGEKLGGRSGYSTLSSGFSASLSLSLSEGV